jgi:hypothetical protein
VRRFPFEGDRTFQCRVEASQITALVGCNEDDNSEHNRIVGSSCYYKSMQLAQVFISHSTKTPRAEAYLSALLAAFKAHGRIADCSRWLDRQALKPGDEWRAEIFKALRESHAAILLLSREAIEQSTFVEIEASYLCVRSAAIPVIPVLIDIEPSDLGSGIWRELRISELQAIRDCDPVNAASQALERLKNLIDFDRISPRNSLERLRGLIARDLMGAQITFDDVLAISQEIEGLSKATTTAFPRDRNNSDACRWLADALSHSPPVYVEQALKKLREYRPEHAKILGGLLDRLAPYWVDEDTALKIGFIATGDRAQRQFGIGIRDDWTLEAYVCRARSCMLGEEPQPLPYPPITREGEAASIDAEAESIAKFVIDQFDLLDDEDLKEFLRQQEEQGWPVVVSFNPDWWPPSPALLAAVRKRLDCVTLCFKFMENNVGGETNISLLGSAIRLTERDISIRYKRVKQALVGRTRRDENAR